MVKKVKKAAKRARKKTAKAKAPAGAGGDDVKGYAIQRAELLKLAKASAATRVQ
jgi:hypothetical protein